MFDGMLDWFAPGISGSNLGLDRILLVLNQNALEHISSKEREIVICCLVLPWKLNRCEKGNL